MPSLSYSVEVVAAPPKKKQESSSAPNKKKKKKKPAGSQQDVEMADIKWRDDWIICRFIFERDSEIRSSGFSEQTGRFIIVCIQRDESVSRRFVYMKKWRHKKLWTTSGTIKDIHVKSKLGQYYYQIKIQLGCQNFNLKMIKSPQSKLNFT